MSATVLPPETVTSAPQTIHNCPNCSHWLPDGTLACPDCQTLTYGQHLSQLATSAQQMEQAQNWRGAREQWRAALEWLPGDTRQAASIQQHVAQIDARLKAEEDQKARWTKRLGPLAPVALFLIKMKSWFFLLFKMKFLLSIVAYFGLYWALLGWRFAVGLTASIFIHEMGHYVAVKRRGLKADLPVFLPGLGAYVRWYGMGVSRDDLAAIALAGPLFGLAAGLTAYAIFWGTHILFFQVMAYLCAWLNLINLFPVQMPFLALDGAQAAYGLTRSQRLLVAATCLLFFGLTVSANVGGDLFGPHTRWVFLIIGAGMGWRSLSQDAPKEANSRTFAYFQGLVVVLGVLLLLSQIPGM